MKTNIDIIIAHYNGSHLFQEQLESIQKNILPEGYEIQILVIDDGSRQEEYDRLLQICIPWPNVTIERNPQNLGIIQTFEKGLRSSTAPYVMLSDQDDVWLSNKIKLTLEGMQESENHKPTLVFTDLSTVSPNLKIINKQMLNLKNFNVDNEKNSLLFQNMVPGCTVMVNRRLLELALPFPSYIPMHDHWLAICAAFGGNLIFIPQATLLYRQHCSNQIGQPNRSLFARMKKPARTIKRFSLGLLQKSNQALELSRRLSGKEKEFTLQAAEAFAHPSFRNLYFLIRSGIFKAGTSSLFLMSILYIFSKRIFKV